MQHLPEDITLNFSPASLWILNFCLAFIMFGVALDLRWSDFKRVFAQPKASLVGILSQFLLLPALTYLLIRMLNPSAGLAMGMFLVAACPGGNISNFMSHMAKGNTALSVTLTAFATLMAALLTPLNFTFWAGLRMETAELLKVVSIQPLDMVKTIAVLIILPLICGIWVSGKFPEFVMHIKSPVKKLSIVIFLVFIVLAFINNYEAFTKYIHYVIFLVFLHNASALSGGYVFAKLTGLTKRDARTIVLETGLQNSGLGLVLIFNFFNGYGPMALVAAWWGVWHIISGLSLSWFWSKK